MELHGTPRGHYYATTVELTSRTEAGIQLVGDLYNDGVCVSNVGSIPRVVNYVPRKINTPLLRPKSSHDSDSQSLLGTYSQQVYECCGDLGKQGSAAMEDSIVGIQESRWRITEVEGVLKLEAGTRDSCSRIAAMAGVLKLGCRTLGVRTGETSCLQNVGGQVVPRGLGVVFIPPLKPTTAS
ncbi:hypothetical protein NDU88_002704 [Pleurodeles waltl]|uniref:Uncharacterized protein n=1 Tax=Pleurodeles waltl TaxID=8319 RepID=A0AAV7SEF2_PLEWA|nr:hypothetical protein NDU88_002704 [Pleurodeles waltl]